MWSLRLLTVLLILRPNSALRCYTDLAASKSLSVECGLNTGCVKIFMKGHEYDHNGNFIPVNLRAAEITLFRGCFLVAPPKETCFDDKKDGLSYCWCKQKDLCNTSATTTPTLPFILTLLCIVHYTSKQMMIVQTSP